MGAVAGLILAGGRGSRLGGALKARLIVHGQYLLDRAIVQAGADVSPLVISIGGHAPEVFDRWPHHLLVADPSPHFPGPIGGLAAAVVALAESNVTHVLTLAVDTPFLPNDFAGRMLEAQRLGFPVVMAREGGRLQPAHALWDLTALAQRLRETDAVTRQLGPRQLFERQETGYVDFVPSAAGFSFAGINTLSDLVAMHSRY